MSPFHGGQKTGNDSVKRERFTLNLKKKNGRNYGLGLIRIIRHILGQPVFTWHIQHRFIKFCLNSEESLFFRMYFMSQICICGNFFVMSGRIFTGDFQGWDYQKIKLDFSVYP